MLRILKKCWHFLLRILSELKHRKKVWEIKKEIRNTGYEKSAVTPSEAQEAIRSVYSFPETSFTQETSFDPVCDVMLIIPVYNVRQYLEECIRSVLNQKTKYSYIAVFVDDGSTDGSYDLLKKYEAEDKIRILRQNNAGAAAARNLALRKIIGRFVSFVDADDYISENYVESLADAAAETGADLVEGSFCMFDGAGLNADFVHKRAEIDEDFSELSGYPWGKLCRAELFADLCFPTGLWYEDTIIKSLLCASCKKIVTIPEVLYYYRQHPAGMSKKKQDYKCLDTYSITKFCYDEKKKRGQRFNEDACGQFVQQLITNEGRLCWLPDRLRESVFVLECELFGRYFDTERVSGDYFNLIIKALKNKSYAAFRIIYDNRGELSY